MDKKGIIGYSQHPDKRGGPFRQRSDKRDGEQPGMEPVPKSKKEEKKVVDPKAEETKS